MTPSEPLDIDDSLLQGQMEFLARAAAGSCVFTGLLAGLLSLGLWKYTPHAVNAGWTGTMLTLTLLRFVHARRYLRMTPEPDLTRRFQRRFTVGALASAFGWGSAAIFLFPFDSVPHQSFLSFALAGTTASAITLYAPLKWALRAYLGLTLVPLAAVHFSQADEAHIAMGALVVIYIGLMFRFVALANRTLVDSLALRHENNTLIAELTAAKAQSDRVNQQLKAEISVRAETESHLIEARDRAEQAARAKSEFLATMSHEIRTPMNGVLGMTELLMGTELSTKQHKFVDTIKRSGSALIAIINDILDYSKIEAGKLELAHSAFDLRQLIEDTMVFFAEPAQRKKIELVTDFPPTQHGAYRGDPERIRQILMNLLGNAVKFTTDGEIALSVATVAEQGDETTLEIAVRDSGIGIKPEHQAHIFDSFQQADGSTTRRFGGTGLGLAICQRLVHLMAGDIGVRSEPGRGSTFHFTMRLHKLPADQIPRSSDVEHDFSGFQILVVDSNDTSRTVLKQQLESWGIKTYAANSAEFALKYLHKSIMVKKPFDAIIFDNTLSDSDGLVFASKLRKISQFNKVRLILLSTMNMLEQTGQWLNAGIDNYVSKPIRQAELSETLVAVLPVRERASAPREQRQAQTDNAIGAHVLVAEDNLVNQELARAMLDNLGCTSVLVENGQEAFEAVAEAPFDTVNQPYDLILMDCQMPVLDGFEATRQIRAWEQAQEHRSALPIIALTANSLQGDRERCLAAGMSDYVSKPFSQDDLALAIRRWLTLERAPRAQAAPPAPTETATRTVLSPQAAAVLDPRALNNIRALQQPGQPDVLLRIISMYRSSAPALIEKLHAAAADGAADKLMQAAHSLKSSTANLGATRLADLCQKLETCGREDRLADAAALLDVVDFELEAVLNALGLNAAEQAA